MLRWRQKRAKFRVLQKQSLASRRIFEVELKLKSNIFQILSQPSNTVCEIFLRKDMYLNLNIVNTKSSPEKKKNIVLFPHSPSSSDFFQQFFKKKSRTKNRNEEPKCLRSSVFRTSTLFQRQGPYIRSFKLKKKQPKHMQGMPIQYAV